MCQEAQTLADQSQREQGVNVGLAVCFMFLTPSVSPLPPQWSKSGHNSSCEDRFGCFMSVSCCQIGDLADEACYHSVLVAESHSCVVDRPLPAFSPSLLMKSVSCLTPTCNRRWNQVVVDTWETVCLHAGDQLSRTRLLSTRWRCDLCRLASVPLNICWHEGGLNILLPKTHKMFTAVDTNISVVLKPSGAALYSFYVVCWKVETLMYHSL